MQVIKAKYKLEDVVRGNLCLPQAERRQCRQINEAALAGHYTVQCTYLVSSVTVYILYSTLLEKALLNCP